MEHPERSFCTPRAASPTGSYLPPTEDSLPCLSTSIGHQTSQENGDQVWVSKDTVSAGSHTALTVTGAILGLYPGSFGSRPALARTAPATSSALQVPAYPARPAQILPVCALEIFSTAAARFLSQTRTPSNITVEVNPLLFP